MWIVKLNKILLKNKKSNAYKKHANSTSIDSIKDDDIIVHLDKGKTPMYILLTMYLVKN